VHKPGVIALRPQTVGDFFDGAFKTIRRNPTAMVGLGAAVTLAFMVIPVLLTLTLAATGDLSTASLSDGSGTAGDELAAGFGAGSATLIANLGSLFSWLASVVLAGMLVRVVSQAVLGRPTGIGDAWTATRGRLLRLVGLALLDLLVALLLIAVPVGLGLLAGVTIGVVVGFLVGVPLVLAGIAAALFVHVRFFLLAAPALVLEHLGIFASLRRAGQLSKAQFWRLLGTLLLTGLVAGIVSYVFAIPLGLLSAAGPFLIPGTGGALLLVFSNYLSQVLVGAVVTPFTAAVTALQYIDQRIRKEGLDVQLIAASQQPDPR